MNRPQIQLCIRLVDSEKIVGKAISEKLLRFEKT